VTSVGSVIAVDANETPTVTFSDRETPKRGGHAHFS
jgi:hypothetical protein